MKNTISTTGIIIGLLAVTAAFLSPWIVNTVSPPVPAEEQVVDFATRLKDAAVAKAKGEKYVPSVTPPKDTGDYVAPGIIGIGMLSMSLGVVSIARGERRLLGGLATFLGIAAAVVQWSIMIACAIIFLLAVAIVLNALGIDLDF